MLLDVLMPGRSGADVLRELKADADLRHLPVLMISALDEMDTVIRCIELGAEDYLAKPFDAVLLRAPAPADAGGSASAAVPGESSSCRLPQRAQDSASMSFSKPQEMQMAFRSIWEGGLASIHRRSRRRTTCRSARR